MKRLSLFVSPNINFRRIIDISFRVVPAVILFCFIKSIDFVNNIPAKALFLDVILFCPLILPFFRFGIPVFLQQTVCLNEKKKHVDNVYLLQLFLFLIIQPFIFFNQDFYLICSFSIAYAMLFNFGSFLIRQGNRNGFIIQNGFINFCLLVTVAFLFYFDSFDNTNHFLTLIGMFSAFIAFVLISPRKLKSSLKKIPKIRMYILDSVSTFFIPFVTLLAIKLTNNAQTDTLILIKISAFISGTIGALILLRIHLLDETSINCRLVRYTQIKNEQRGILLVMSLLGLATSFIFIPDIFHYFFFFIGIEYLILKFGQMNILLNYNGETNKALISTCFTAIISLGLFLLLVTVFQFESQLAPMLFYLTSIATFHLSCRFMISRCEHG